MADADRSGRDETVLSRRGFLGRSTLAAGVLGAVSSRPVAAGPGPARGGTGPARHPLDPLSAEEIGEAARVVRADRSLGPACRFVAIALAEPAKSVVDGFRLGDPFPRGADVLVLDNATGRAHHGLVDLRSAVVQSYEPLPEGLQPSVTVDEFAECEDAIKRSPEFLALLKARGVADADLVMVDAWSAGNYGDERPEERGKRLVRALCFVRSGPSDNGYARPLDGVIVVVDLNTMEVVRIEDYGVVPLPPEAGNWAGAVRCRRPDAISGR